MVEERVVALLHSAHIVSGCSSQYCTIKTENNTYQRGCGHLFMMTWLVHLKNSRGVDVPSHGSGSVAACRSSIENLTSTPFTIRDSGSAFRSQYDWPSGPNASSSTTSIVRSGSFSFKNAGVRGALVAFCFMASFPVDDFCGTLADSCLALPAVLFLFLPATSVEVSSADLGGLPRRLPGLPVRVVLVLTMGVLVLGLPRAVAFLAGAVDLAGLPYRTH